MIWQETVSARAEARGEPKGKVQRSLERLDPPQPWLRRWLSIARWHNATLELTEEGFVRLTVAGRSVTKRNLTSFDFNDLPGKPC